MLTLGLEMVLLTSSMGQWQTLLFYLLFGSTYFTGIVQYIIEEKMLNFRTQHICLCLTENLAFFPRLSYTQRYVFH